MKKKKRIDQGCIQLIKGGSKDKDLNKCFDLSIH